MSNPLAPEWLDYPADVNAIAESVWPRHAKRRATGELEVAGVPVTEIANQYGTPIYVIDEDDFRARATAAKTALTDAAKKIGTHAKVYYASKAFLSTEIVGWIDELGLNIDVASGGELAAALAGGIEPARIGLHGNNKSLREIGRAVTAGVGAIVIDSEIEIERIASAAGAQDKVQPVRLRVNTGVHANTHDFLATAREDQKFGISIADAPALVAKIRSHTHLEFLGFHQHVGSQIFNAEGFVESTKRLIALHAETLKGGVIPELNLGGGFGVNYKIADKAPNNRSDKRPPLACVLRVCCGLARGQQIDKRQHQHRDGARSEVRHQRHSAAMELHALHQDGVLVGQLFDQTGDRKQLLPQFSDRGLKHLDIRTQALE